MRAHVLERISDVREGSAPLGMTELPDPAPHENDVLLRVSVCGVCHTELDEIEGRTPPPHVPMVPGHQVVGRIVSMGTGVRQGSGAARRKPRAVSPEPLAVGDRVGVAWIFSACGECVYCTSGRENLCARFEATGRDRFGGYAGLMVAPAAFVHRIPDTLTDDQAAPLLCAGAIGYRSLTLAGIRNGQTLGLSGFGASGHLVLKMAAHRMPDTRVFVFARSDRERAFARELGAAWAGRFDETPPARLDAVIDTTPAWMPVVHSLDALAPGGRLVINAIRKEAADRAELLKLDYPRHLWMEKEIKSVANVTRQDVRDCLALAAEIPLAPAVQLYPFADANRALVELKTQSVVGAKVLQVG
jgi:propanol-preferring alcohol dehydrogenase